MHELYAKGYSIRKISKLLKMDRKTITRKLKESSYSEVLVRKVNKPSILEPYKNYIKTFISKSSYRIPSSVILEDIRELGYPGGRSVVQEFLKAEYNNRNLVADPVVRFETAPGEQMQVDWTTIRSGCKPIYAFVATMGYSRHTFVYFTDNMEVMTLVKSHELAFLFFCGVPKTILYDNMKTIVITRDAYGKGKHKFHGAMYDLAKRLGFTIRLCRPYRAKTKGKVERFNSYLKGNFYRPLLVKLKDAKLEVTVQVLNNYIYQWLSRANNRIHDTTKQKPCVLFAQEQLMLLPYLAQPMESSATYVKTLPHVIVYSPQLSEYDDLLTMEVVA